MAESWEISGHPAAPTIADRGYWKGRTLPAILARLGEQLVGSHARWALARDRFPLLVKLLDVQQDLSLQVHPDDAYALAYEGGDLGKTEMWYFLEAAPEARLILGLRPGTTRAAFSAALESGRLAEVLNYLPIRAGQAVAVPAGTLHALLAGTVVTEIQQTSDLTYRVYDWGRLGADGKPRPLHIEKALDVIAFDRPAPGVASPIVVHAAGGVVRKELVRNRYFVVEEVTLEPGACYGGYCDGTSLEIWGCLAGQVRISEASEDVLLSAIRYALLPAALGPFSVDALQPSTCLRVYLPAAG